MCSRVFESSGGILFASRGCVVDPMPGWMKEELPERFIRRWWSVEVRPKSSKPCVDVIVLLTPLALNTKQINFIANHTFGTKWAIFFSLAFLERDGSI